MVVYKGRENGNILAYTLMSSSDSSNLSSGSSNFWFFPVPGKQNKKLVLVPPRPTSLLS